jgi:hypothetical protein
MKIKNILLGALLGAGLATTASAQVYSQNVVGYVTVHMTNGYNLIANQLDSDGTGTNNTVGSIIGASLPVNSIVYKWNGTGWDPSTYKPTSFAPGAPTNWTDPTFTINPGEGFMVFIPSPVQQTNFTFAGNVLQGTNSSGLPVGYTVAANPYPVTVDLNTNYTAQVNDEVMQWDPSTGWVPHTYKPTSFAPGAPTNWVPALPPLQLGEAVMFYPAGAKSWTNSLIVQ